MASPVAPLEAVERECPQQLLEFVECVEAQPHSWQTRCDQQVLFCLHPCTQTLHFGSPHRETPDQ